MRLVLCLLLSVALVTSCGSPFGQCNPNTCSGCCDANNSCRGGREDVACGTQGLSCVECVGGVCEGGICLERGDTRPSTGGGGEQISTQGGGGGGISSNTGGGGGTISSGTCSSGSQCAVVKCTCGDQATVDSQRCVNQRCITDGSQCADVCTSFGHPAPGQSTATNCTIGTSRACSGTGMTWTGSACCVDPKYAVCTEGSSSDCWGSTMKWTGARCCVRDVVSCTAGTWASCSGEWTGQRCCE